jgi:hypothetical protein
MCSTCCQRHCRIADCPDTSQAIRNQGRKARIEVSPKCDSRFRRTEIELGPAPGGPLRVRWPHRLSASGCCANWSIARTPTQIAIATNPRFDSSSNKGESLRSIRVAAVAVAVLAILHSIATTQAAPTLFRQRAIADNESALPNSSTDSQSGKISVRCFSSSTSQLSFTTQKRPDISFAMSHRSLSMIFSSSVIMSFTYIVRFTSTQEEEAIDIYTRLRCNQRCGGSCVRKRNYGDYCG